MTKSEHNKNINEVMLLRLLHQCEVRARENEIADDWRLERYVEGAEDMLKQLLCDEKLPSKDSLADFRRRIDFLKKFIESKNKNNSLDRILSAHNIPHGVSTSDNLTQEIHQKTASKFTRDIRNELFSSPLNVENEPRFRRNEKSSGEDLDALQKYHHKMQEKIAENMLQLTRNLKEQSQLANTIIKKDTETMGKTTQATDENLTRLRKEAEILEEHNRRAWKCWLWLIIGLVIIIFLVMVMFMKIVKKR